MYHCHFQLSLSILLCCALRNVGCDIIDDVGQERHVTFTCYFPEKVAAVEVHQSSKDIESATVGHAKDEVLIAFAAGQFKQVIQGHRCAFSAFS